METNNEFLNKCKMNIYSPCNFSTSHVFPVSNDGGTTVAAENDGDDVVSGEKNN